MAHFNVLNKEMDAFRHLLSPKQKFAWTPELEAEFETSKENIVKLVANGVAIFEPNETTILNTDWSEVGIGYWLYQKTCKCPFDPNPNKCCDSGWRVTSANSRAIRPAKRNYWPTEGEALGVAWALNDSKFFTMGCSDLHVTTDHRPLITLIGNKDLADIDNRRLASFKERTFPWDFQIHYV